MVKADVFGIYREAKAMMSRYQLKLAMERQVWRVWRKEVRRLVRSWVGLRLLSDQGRRCEQAA
jgi:hypothetical protein